MITEVPLFLQPKMGWKDDGGLWNGVPSANSLPFKPQSPNEIPKSRKKAWKKKERWEKEGSKLEIRGTRTCTGLSVAVSSRGDFLCAAVSYQ